MNFLSKLVGWRVIIVNAVLVATGILRHKGHELPDDATITTIVNTILDGLVSVPGLGVINVLMRIFLTKTPVPGTKPAA